MVSLRNRESRVDFGTLPAMTIDRIGCGAGEKDFAEQGNILKLIVGQAAGDTCSDQVCVLETNLDDVTGEMVAHCAEQLLAAGALDVFTTSIHMKKNRPGTLLTVLCEPVKRPSLPTRRMRRSPKGVPMPLFTMRATASLRFGSAQAPEPPNPKWP